MRRTEWLQETRRMRFEEAYDGWQAGRLRQEEAAQLLGVCERTFRRYIDRYEEDGLIDRRLNQISHRRAPVDEVMALTNRYRQRRQDWSARHFFAWYRRDGGTRGYSWVKRRLQEARLVPRAPRRGAHRKRRAQRWPGTHSWRPIGRQALADPVRAGTAAARHRDDRGLFPAGPRSLRAGLPDPSAAPRARARRRRALEPGSAFVLWAGAHFDDILCEQFERKVGAENCVSFGRLTLQIPRQRHRCHFVKLDVRVHRYLDDSLAIFHGPRCLARYTDDGQLQEDIKHAA